MKKRTLISFNVTLLSVFTLNTRFAPRFKAALGAWLKGMGTGMGLRVICRCEGSCKSLSIRMENT